MDRSAQGFTLVELIIVITLAGIVAAMIGSVMGRHMESYVDMNDRAQLVQMGQSALQTMTRHIRGAAPNSVRINVAGTTIEFVPVVYAGAYRKALGDGGEDILDFTVQDNSFDVFADLVDSDTSLNSAQVVIYNLGQESGGSPVLGSNLYANNTGGAAHVITSAGLTIIDNGNEDNIELATRHQFSAESPTQRMYLVNGAARYQCGSNAINQYTGYAIQETLVATPAGATQSLLVDQISDCKFEYFSGNATTESMVVVTITLSGRNQSLRLVQQIHLGNAP